MKNPPNNSVSTKNAMERPVKNSIAPSPSDDFLTAEYDYLKSSSATDCTGLIPAAPANEEEVENYEELYKFLPQAAPASEESGS